MPNIFLPLINSREVVVAREWPGIGSVVAWKSGGSVSKEERLKVFTSSLSKKYSVCFIINKWVAPKKFI